VSPGATPIPAACFLTSIPVPLAFDLILPMDRELTAGEATSSFAMPRHCIAHWDHMAMKRRGKDVRSGDKMFLAEGTHLWLELLEEVRLSQNPWEIRAHCKTFQFAGTFPPFLNGRINKHRSAQAGVRGGLGCLLWQQQQQQHQQQAQASPRCRKAELLAGRLPAAPH